MTTIHIHWRQTTAPEECRQELRQWINANYDPEDTILYMKRLMECLLLSNRIRPDQLADILRKQGTEFRVERSSRK